MVHRETYREGQGTEKGAIQYTIVSTKEHTYTHKVGGIGDEEHAIRSSGGHKQQARGIHSHPGGIHSRPGGKQSHPGGVHVGWQLLKGR